jgi:HlyD family secretion protein
VVFVVTEGKAVQRPVETGLADETGVEISSGLAAGERIVTGPYRVLKDLKDGEDVTIDERKDEDAKDEDG